ncbi:hypothetical protein, partial [Cereibacter johrii]|uniref:hypothetical protein n=1 Tax=Cereibacter johrii TaxID=445629 RepID=UPI003CF58CA3
PMTILRAHSREGSANERQAGSNDINGEDHRLQLTELIEGMGDVLAAAGNLTLRFRVAVEFADGEFAPPDVAAKLAAALDKVGIGVG